MLGFEGAKIIFLAFQKIRQLHFIRSHLYKKVSKMVVILWNHYLWQVGYMLENFQVIWNCTTYRKKIVSRKVENDSKY